MKFYLQVTKKLRTFALNLSVCTYATQNYLFSADCANHSPRFLFYIAILSTFLTTQRCTSNLNLGTEHGLRKKITLFLGASQPTIRLALDGDDSTEQKRRIRYYALRHGGVELR